MGGYKNKWGLYPWFIEHGKDLVHQEDLKSFQKLFPYGKVFYCEDNLGDFISLRYGVNTFRVKPHLFRKVKAPTFLFGDKVKLLQHQDTVGVITDIEWHFKKNSEMYFIEIDGKRKTSRYFTNDLIKLDS